MGKFSKKWKYFIKDIEKKYCNQVSDIIYDKWNMNGKDYELEEVFTWIKNILEKICVDQKNYGIYIRVHSFRTWYIIRIGGYGNISPSVEQSVYEISVGNLIRIENNEKKEFLITAACTNL